MGHSSTDLYDTIPAGGASCNISGSPDSEMGEDQEVLCPTCGSEAFYRYGRTRQGKQRFRCLLCGRQFTTDRKRKEVRNRPNCHVCGCAMHAYKHEADGTRFRCSAYPDCRTFLKVKHEPELT